MLVYFRENDRATLRLYGDEKKNYNEMKKGIKK